MEAENSKMYQSIGKVAEMLNVNISLLRFWEKEFPMLKPFKNKKGTRYYRPQDIDLLRQIYYLTKECGYTLEGAKERLRKNPQQITAKTEALKTLQNVRSFLIDIRNNLESKEEVNEE